MLFTILSSLILISCGENPPNIEACGRKIFGAACSWTIDGPRRTLTEEQALELFNKRGTIFMSADSFGEIKTFIDAICSDKKSKCKKNKELIQNIDALMEEIDDSPR